MGEPKVATTASEVLSRALEFWGPEMERWVVGTTWDGANACIYGGLQIGSGQRRNLSLRARLVPNWSEITNSIPYRKAEKYLLDELEAQGWPRSIVSFNDEGSGYESYEMYTRPGRSTDGWVKRRARIKGVVCGALKRALADESAADTSEEVRGGEGEQTNQRI